MSAERAAARGIVAGVEGLEDFPPPTDMPAVARRIVAEWSAAGLHLRFHRGEFHRWTGTHYEGMPRRDITSRLQTRLEAAKYWHSTKNGQELRRWPVTTPNKNQVFDHIADLEGLVYVDEPHEAPVWLAGSDRPWSGSVIACRNGLLELGTRVLHPHTPAWFNQVSVPFAYDPAAPEPTRWLAFLDQVWPDDPAAIEALKMWFGYVLSGRTELHKILLLVGPPRSGKGTVAGLLEALVGKGHTTNPTLAGLGSNFGLAPLVGKSLAIIGDARLTGRTDGGPIVERLLSISGEDSLTVDRKYRDAWTGRLPTRFMILSNELPRLGDASGAVANRFITLSMSRSWLGSEDTTLGPALHAELPGIFRWALDGLDELDARGALVEPQTSSDARQALDELTSPTKAFLRDCTTEGGTVLVPYLWAAWQQWCAENGHQPGSVQTLSRNLRAARPDLRTIQPRSGPGGARERYFVGLRVHESATPRPPYPGGVR